MRTESITLRSRNLTIATSPALPLNVVTSMRLFKAMSEFPDVASAPAEVRLAVSLAVCNFCSFVADLRSASQDGHEAGFAPLEAIPKFALVRELPRPLAASIPYDAVGLPPMPGWKSAGSGSQRSSPFSCGTEVKSDVAPKTVKRAESRRMLLWRRSSRMLFDKPHRPATSCISCV